MNTANASVFGPTVAAGSNGLAIAVWYYGGAGVPIDVYANVFR